MRKIHIAPTLESREDGLVPPDEIKLSYLDRRYLAALHAFVTRDSERFSSPTETRHGCFSGRSISVKFSPKKENVVLTTTSRNGDEETLFLIVQKEVIDMLDKKVEKVALHRLLKELMRHEGYDEHGDPRYVAEHGGKRYAGRYVERYVESTRGWCRYTTLLWKEAAA